MQNSNNLLSKYLNQYQKNPKSRVFAPLAETYRKVGMLDEAIKTIKQGLRHYKDYQLAHVVLGHCYFDKEEFHNAYTTIQPLVQKNPDNLKLQRLFAQIAYRLNYLNEALQAYKYVMFLNPGDLEAKEKVLELEDTVAEQEFYHSDDKVTHQTTEAEDWVSMDYSDDFDVKELKPTTETIEEIDQWQMVGEKDEDATAEIKKSEITETEVMTTDDLAAATADDDSPLVTNTLVDIYIAQKHYDKAKTLLENLLKNDPKSKVLKEKYQKVVNRMDSSHNEGLYKQIEAAFWEFHELLTKKSLQFTSRPR